MMTEFFDLVPRLLTWINFIISAWINNYIHYKMQVEITYPFPNFNSATIEIWEWMSNFILHFMACDYLSMLSNGWVKVCSISIGDSAVDIILQGSTLSFLAGCPKSHFLDWYRNFLVHWYLKLDNQVVNSTCPRDKLGWIWRADDP